MPEIVIGYEPAGVVEEVVMASAEEFPLAGFGLKLAVAPAGNPLAESVSESLKPPTRFILTV